MPGSDQEILFRVAERVKLPLTLVANRLLRVPMGFDVPQGTPTCYGLKPYARSYAAYRHIVQVAEAGDLVITADIPLAAALVDQQVIVLNPRGELYDAENIRERLSMRDWMEGLRGAGVETAGPQTFSQADR